MAVYDLEEQDQLDDLKAWWTRYGNAVTAVAVVIALAFAGYQGWKWWNAKQAEEASALYSAVQESARAKDLQKAKDATAQLEDRFAGTGYAPRSALVLAKLLFDSGDVAGARAQLQWVVDRGSDGELKEIARYRLAQAFLHDKQYDEALKMLDAKHGESFAGLYADLRGDALAAAGRTEEAKAAYQLAIGKFDAKSQYKNFVQVKLESLGGTAAPAAGSAGAIVIPPPSPAPAAAAPATPPAAAPAAPAPAAPAEAPKK